VLLASVHPQRPAKRINTDKLRDLLMRPTFLAPRQ
jgi:hypothetical protein